MKSQELEGGAPGPIGPTVQHRDIGLFDYDELSESYGIENLDDELGSAVFRLEEDDRRVVQEASWYRFVRDCITHRCGDAPGVSMGPTQIPADRIMLGSDRLKKLLDKDEQLADLFRAFVEGLLEANSWLKVKVNDQTITFLLRPNLLFDQSFAYPRGLKTGLRLRAGKSRKGLFLLGARVADLGETSKRSETEPRECWVTAPEDFEEGWRFVTGESIGQRSSTR
ncbi:MAG: hypothetical protein M3P30_07450 [Chloroflexota bacterium]|nr:hypothetical protein [Chloroflexota bacterium]